MCEFANYACYSVQPSHRKRVYIAIEDENGACDATVKKVGFSVVLLAALLLVAGWFAMEDGFGKKEVSIAQDPEAP